MTETIDQPAYLIPFTQYLLPDGRKKQVKWKCTTGEQETKARALVDAGAVFECEILQTRLVSLTCEMADNEGEMQTLAHEICQNSPEVIKAMEVLVSQAHETFFTNSPEA